LDKIKKINTELFRTLFWENRASKLMSILGLLMLFANLGLNYLVEKSSNETVMIMSLGLVFAGFGWIIVFLLLMANEFNKKAETICVIKRVENDLNVRTLQLLVFGIVVGMGSEWALQIVKLQTDGSDFFTMMYVNLVKLAFLGVILSFMFVMLSIINLITHWTASIKKVIIFCVR